MEEIKNRLKSMLNNGKIDGVLGFVEQRYPLKNYPVFARTEKDIDKITNSLFSILNIATYIRRIKNYKKIAVFVRGCEERAINLLCAEHQIERDKLFLIGFPCEGVVDLNFLKKEYGRDIEGIERRDRTLVIKGKRGEFEISLDQVISVVCKNCIRRDTPTVDLSIQEDENREETPDFSFLKDIEEKTYKDRWQFFKEQFEKCTRCYACREVCPMCYCESCFVDSNDPVWVEPGYSVEDIVSFHLIKIFHMAGRCVNCGACERSCSEGIRLSYLTSKITKDLIEDYDYISGETPEQKPMFGEYKIDDKGDFIL